MTRHRAPGIAALLLLLLTASWPAAGQEERAIDHFAGVGVRAMGLGGAFVGVADDFTAMVWNPAGLAQIGHREVFAALQRTQHQAEAARNGVAASDALTRTRFGSLGMVVPYPAYRGSLVFAAGVIRLKDFDWALRERGTDDQGWTVDNSWVHQGQLTLTGVSGAVDVSPAVSLGLTLGLTSGVDDVANEFTYTDTQDLFTEKRFVARETSHDDYQRSTFACAGIMLRAPREAPLYRVAATLTTGGTQRVAYVFRGVPSESGYDRIEYDDGSVRLTLPQQVRDAYRLSLPFEFGLGGSATPLPGLLLAASVHRSEWEQARYASIDGDRLRAASDFRRQYRNTGRYHFGVEWQVPTVALDLRAGYYSDPLPFVGPRDPNSAVDPGSNPVILVVQDRRFVTLGAGLLLDEVVQVDLAWNRGTYEQTEGALTESGTINRIITGVSYRF